MTKIVKLSKKDFGKILNEYKIGKYVNHKYLPWALGNDVYRLNTTKGKFILKLHKENDLKNFNYILNIEKLVRRRKVPIPELMETKSGREFILYNKKAVTVQKFIEGKEGNSKSIKEIKLIAKTMAITDKALLKIPLKKKNTGRIMKSVRRIPGFDMAKYDGLLNKNFKIINERKLRKSVIHADLGGNYIVKNNKVVAIIDWEDAHEDRLVMEPAVFIASNFVSEKGVKKNKVKIFMKEYQRYMKLNKEEKKALYYLIQSRQLGVIAYIAMHSKKRKKNKKLRNFLNICIKKYHVFSKVTPKEFLKWIDIK